MKYSFPKGLLKAVVAMVLFAIPVLGDVLPKEWMDLSLGGALVLLANYLKVRFLV